MFVSLSYLSLYTNDMWVGLHLYHKPQQYDRLKKRIRLYFTFFPKLFIDFLWWNTHSTEFSSVTICKCAGWWLSSLALLRHRRLCPSPERFSSRETETLPIKPPPVPLPPQVPTILFSLSRILTTEELREIIRCLSFCGWLVSLSIFHPFTCSSFIHIAAYVKAFFLFKAE